MKFLSFFMAIVMLFALSGCESGNDISNTTASPSITDNDLSNETNIIDTTHSVETKEPPTIKEPTKIKLSFVGDAMLACYKDETTSGSFNEYSNKYPSTYFLEKVKHIFEADDFTIVNLENVFSDSKLSPISKSGDRVFWFKSKTSNVNILTTSSVEGVSLANNHTGDYGEQGKNDTIKTINDANLQYGLNDHIMYFEKDGYKIAIICYGLWSEYGTSPIIEQLKKAEETSDFQVVFYHGGTEKMHSPEEWRIRASRKLVDNSADLVIGNHPHVLQPREVYNGVEILYSLGNFCYGGHRSPENRTIIYQIELELNEDNTIKNTTSTITPCYVFTGNVNNYQPAPIEDKNEIKTVLDFMEGKLDLPY